MTFKAPKPKPRDPVPAGNHVARLYQIVHLGTIPTTFKGEEKMTNSVRLTFELCNELKVFKEGEGAKPYSISTRDTTLSMNKKAGLRKLVEGMTGKAFTEEEAVDFDLESLLGSACLLNVVHMEKDGNIYANIQGASPLPKGLTAPTISNEAKLLDVETMDLEDIEALPDFLKEKMHASVEYQKRINPDYETPIEKNEFDQSTTDEDDAHSIPF